MKVPKTSQNPDGFRWTARRALAAQLVAEDRLNEEEIAQKVNVSRRAVFAWRMHPVFAARVAAILAETSAKLVADGIRLRANRLRMLQDSFDRMNQVIAERAADPSMADVPGGTTGLLVREPHVIKMVLVDLDAEGSEILTSTRRSLLVYTYSLDAALLRELRETMKQAAIEVGEWMEKRDITSGGQPVSFTLKLSNDDNVRVHPPALFKVYDGGVAS